MARLDALIRPAANPAESGIGRNCPPITVGRYTLFAAIAQGGMASVHIGRVSGAAGFARTVAIKRLHPQFAADPEFVSMFVDEARLAARVQHPNVVSVLDVVALEGELFLIMDFIRGDSLSRLLQTHRQQESSPPVDVSVAIVIAALRGLHAAHEARSETGEPLHIVHRDVSPQNILVGVDGTARLVDFGIARASHRSQSTREGQLKGKLDYMAPEQYENQPATRQTDIYAASVVLWEALTARRLLEPAGTPGARVLRVLHGNFPPPSTHNKAVCRGLDRIVLRGLARAPNDRFETAQDMADAIEEAVVPASTTRTAAWVRTLAGDSLERLEREITRVEALSDSALRRAPLLSCAGEDDGSPSHSAIRLVSQPCPPDAQDVDVVVEEPSPSGHVPLGVLLSWKRLWLFAIALVCLSTVVTVIGASALRGGHGAARAFVRQDRLGITVRGEPVHPPIALQEPPPASAAAPTASASGQAAGRRGGPTTNPTPRAAEVHSEFRKLTRR
jgi:eukaryotic-like serine/threonine-protein kinase